jgi:hypothetical protein
VPVGPEKLNLRRAALAGLCLLLTSPVTADPILRETSNVVWQREDSWFGGFSGIEMAADGETITVISDFGSLVTARLLRNDGRINAIQLLSHANLRHANGNVMRGKVGDAEGLALSDDGTLYISFEGRHRVTQVARGSDIAQRMAAIPGSDQFEQNKGFEALARHPDGSLFALPEWIPDRAADFPLYQLKNGRWAITFLIPRNGPFLPVGADFAADGMLYLLERAVSPLGFRTRIRRFKLSTDGLAPQTLRTTGPGRYGNLEGLTVWSDSRGDLRLTTISDDNFMSILQTQIVEFVLTE